VTRSAGPRLEGYAVLTAGCLLGALALRRPELVALGAPFALALVIATQFAREPRLRVTMHVPVDRAVEEDELEVTVTLESDRPLVRVEVGVELPNGIELVEGESRFAVRLGADEARDVPLRLRCARWGVYELGRIDVRARDVLGVVVWAGSVTQTHPLKVFPSSERLRRLLQPVHRLASTGNEVARAKGDGLEFADLRPYVPGDRVKAINWRASARRASLVVNERHPERNTDVVLFLDSFAEVRRDGAGTLDQAVRAAATLAARYLERRDRVGLVTFGGVLRWLQPGMGLVQRYRLIDALLETGVELSYAWKDASIIPAKTLPSGALVIALTPLLDARSVGALVDLRGRGYDIVVVEVSPVGFVQPDDGELGELAHRLWLLHREELRSRFQQLGVAVARWDDDIPLEAALEGVRAYRRHAKPVHA
jgi:uncharacterized protein (DUF58 family)